MGVEWSAQRVRGKARAAVRRREDQIEQEETESGELNLIPYLDMVTNLMLFILASVSAGIILVQIDTTLPDKKAPSTTASEPKPPDEQPLELFVSVKLDSVIIWSINGMEGTLKDPKATFTRTGKEGEACDGGYMCESDTCSASESGLGKCVVNKTIDPTPVFDYRAINKTLGEIAGRRYGGKPRKDDTYHATLQADPAIPYGTVVAVMAAMRCPLPELGAEAKGCAMPTQDKTLTGVSADKKFFNTTNTTYDAKTMAIFPEVRFSSGFEK
jgi:biopolymer transport protein ExbD